MPALFFLPIVVGYSTSSSIKLLEPPNIYKQDSLFHLFWYLIIGTILIVTFAYIFYFFHIFKLDLYTLFVLTLSAILICKRYLSRLDIPLNYSIQNYYKHDKTLFLPVFFGIIIVFFITNFSPFPYIWANDIFRHTGISLTIIEYNDLAMIIPYLLTMHVVVSMVSALFNIENVYVFLWSLRFLVYPLLALGTYLLSFELSNSKQIGLFASVLATWQFSTLYQFAPKTIIILIFPFILYYVIKFTAKHDILEGIKNQPSQSVLLLILTVLTFIALYQHMVIKEYIGLLLLTFLILALSFLKNRFYFFMYIITLFVLLIHTTMGIAVMFCIYIYIISYSSLKFKINWKLCTLLFILISAILIKEMVAHDIIFGIYSEIPGEKIDMLLSDKMDALYNIFSITTIVLAICGYFISFAKHQKYKEVSVLLLFTVVIFIYLLPISESIRFINITTALIAYMGAIAINFIAKVGYKSKNHKTKNIMLTLITICLLLLLTTHNIDMIYKKSNGKFTQIDNNIYSAGLWVGKNTDENTLIISDLMTQEMIAGLSNRKKIRMLMKSRYFPSKYPQYNEIVRILSTNNSKDAYIRINNLKNTETAFNYPIIYGDAIDGINLTPLIIIDKNKTTKWANIPEEGFEKFSNDVYFEEIYSQDGIYIYTLK